MNKSRNWKVGMMAMAVIACALLVAGCGMENSSPVGAGGTNNINTGAIQYATDNLGDPFAVDTSGSYGDALAKTWKLKIDGDTATVGVDGGDLELQMGGFKSKLKIPKNAVSADVRFAVRGLLFKTPFGDLLLYEFGPDGLVFDVPCQLEVDAGQLKDHTLLSLFWFNPSTNAWEFQQQVQVEGHKLKFDIHHFSKYGIS